MSNPKEKIFAFIHDANTSIKLDKLHRFFDVDCSSDRTFDNKKYLHWSKFLPNFYTLATYEDSYWTVQNLTTAVYEYMDKDLRFVIFEVQDAPRQGRMNPKFWEHWTKIEDLTTTTKNNMRSKKLKKIKSYIKQKANLEKREEQLKQKRFEVEKALKLKAKRDKLLREENELKEIEKMLHEDDIEKGIIVDDNIEVSPIKRKRRWFW